MLDLPGPQLCHQKNDEDPCNPCRFVRGYQAYEKINGHFHVFGQMKEYFTNLEFPEIAGVPFPFQNGYLLREIGRVYRSRANLTR